MISCWSLRLPCSGPRDHEIAEAAWDGCATRTLIPCSARTGQCRCQAPLIGGILDRSLTSRMTSANIARHSRVRGRRFLNSPQPGRPKSPLIAVGDRLNSLADDERVSPFIGSGEARGGALLNRAYVAVPVFSISAWPFVDGEPEKLAGGVDPPVTGRSAIRKLIVAWVLSARRNLEPPVQEQRHPVDVKTLRGVRRIDVTSDQ